ncbi:MAG TPA: rhodanese-like domain-containing protein [Steroidobacteraceae bacterium]|jgi:rhodanese-related sulfurtransferase|nr:rhodanese-like domain-containing protein [Steroidobacteraceae bacterium]
MTTQAAAVLTLEPAEVARLLSAGRLLLVDVREPAEYAAERIPGALLYPLSTFDAAALPEDGLRRVVFHCGSGKRSLAAAERRLAAGQASAAHMRGGIAAWKAAGLPVIAPGSSG